MILEKYLQPKYYNLAINCILAIVLKPISTSFENQICIITRIVFKSIISWPRKTKNIIIIGQQLGIISSLRFISIR